MPTKDPPRIFVDSWSSHGTREEIADPAKKRVKLNVHYDGKQATIDMPGGIPLFDREDGAEMYKRELHALLDAIDAALKSDGILWPAPGSRS